jgi:putative DNA primase/helicase
MRELPGILNWSIEGYRRLRERAHFVQPTSSNEAVDDIEMLAAPVRAFVRDRCEVKAGVWATLDDLWSEWKEWADDEGRSDPGSKHWFARNLQSAVPGLTTSRLVIDGNREQVYNGIDIVNPTPPDWKP